MTGAARSPNILMVLVDQMRADHMGHAGDPIVETPPLDRLALGGASFARAYATPRRTGHA